MKHANQQSGFTLIEVMVVVAVLAIAASVGLPRLSAQLDNRQLRADANNIVSDINEKRSAALSMRQNQTVEVGQSSADVTWSRSPSGSLPETITLTPDGKAVFSSGGTASRVTYTAKNSGTTYKIVVNGNGKAEVWK